MFTQKQRADGSPENKESLPDELIVETILGGNINAFELIMRRYNQRLYRVARSILMDNDSAEDAVQQAYISAYCKLRNYTANGRFGAWLTRITINEALMIKRKPDNRLMIKDDILENQPVTDPVNNPADHHSNNELAVLIESAIEALPHDFRLVFILREIQQLSVRETSYCLELNEATVKTRLHRARSLLQQTLNQQIVQAGMHVYEFAGYRCDRIVHSTLEKLALLRHENNDSQIH